MPRLFGVSKPIFSHEVAVKIFHQLDTKSLIETAPLVSKDWQKLSNCPELKETKEAAQNRLRVFDLVQQIECFAQETPDTITVSKLSGGLTNNTYRFAAQSGLFVARKPGKKSDTFIDRKSESINLKIASQYEIAAKVIYDAKQGEQVTQFLENPKPMSTTLLKDLNIIEKIVQPLKVIHQANHAFANEIDVFVRNKRMLSLLADKKITLPLEYKTISNEIDKIEKQINLLEVKKVPCHNDTTPSNFIETNGSVKLIDWEYSGNNDPIWDLANLSMEAEFSNEQDIHLFQSYFGENWDDLLYQRFILYKPVVEFWAGLWAQVQIANQNQSDKLEDLYKIENRIQHCRRLLSSDEFKKAFEKLEASSQRSTLRNC